MRDQRKSQITALGAAMLLLMSSCGSPEEGQDAAASEDSAVTDTPEAADGAQESEEPTESAEPEDSAESAGSAEPTETEPPEDPETSSAPEDRDDAGASSDFSTEVQESAGFPGEFTVGDEPYHLVDIRSGVHEGFERVVFEFSGDGVPSWRGEYTDSAAELGRGEPIEVAGDHILEINVNGPSWAPGEESSEALPAQEYYERDRGGVFEEIFIQGPFEAHSQYLIGLDQELPFQMQLLEEPTRLVVDFATEE
ncbi:AMIN-like domain-containing (lipo)protein [Nesterenkonia sp. CF4.4]|uniref:AMIN-like domain-containing (lipo)protein n=1 Tax=Nesterenkonia sp. CF4.4 TaxID=3373079 RepID=UPI003EE5C094